MTHAPMRPRTIFVLCLAGLTTLIVLPLAGAFGSSRPSSSA